MSTRLPSQVQKAAGIPNGMRTATIVAVTSSTVTIRLSGGDFSSGVGVLESYKPVVGDTVAVLPQDSSWLILGSMAPGVTIGPRGQTTGTQAVTFAAVNNSSVAVSFGVTFPAAPMVVTNIDSNSATATRWTSRAAAITTTGFTLMVFSGDAVSNTWSNIPVSWLATARA